MCMIRMVYCVSGWGSSDVQYSGVVIWDTVILFMMAKEGISAGFLPRYFFLDRFTASSGSKTYAAPPRGKSLCAVCSLMPLNNDNHINIPSPQIVIEGNTIRWSNLYQGLGSYIYTFWR